MAITKALPDHKVEIKDYQHQFLISLSLVLSAALGICMDNLVNICAKNINLVKSLNQAPLEENKNRSKPHRELDTNIRILISGIL